MLLLEPLSLYESVRVLAEVRLPPLLADLEGELVSGRAGDVNAAALENELDAGLDAEVPGTARKEGKLCLQAIF